MSTNPTPAPTIPLTDTIYWASKSKMIQQMMALIRQAYQQGFGTGVATGIAKDYATRLANMGRTGPADLVDNAIMVWNWEPVYTMQLRQMDGYVWTPSLLTPPVQVAPGIVVSGQPSYDPNSPPPLSIKVSTDAADYPPAKD